MNGDAVFHKVNKPNDDIGLMVLFLFDKMIVWDKALHTDSQNNQDGIHTHSLSNVLQLGFLRNPALLFRKFYLNKILTK
jgi:hypothetical protein